MNPQSRRKFLQMVGLSSAAVAAAACQPKVVEVEKVVTQEVEKIIEKVVKETVIVEGTPQVVEKVVTVQAAQPFEGVALRVGHWWGESFNEVANAFSERYPGIELAMEPSPWQGYADKLFTQLAAGTGQDVNFLDASYFFKFWAAKPSLPLNDLFDRDGIERDDFAIDPAIDSGRDGVVYAVPQWHPDSPNLWINVDLFNAAGISVPAYGTAQFNTWKWDDFLEAAKALTKMDAKGNAEQWGSSYFLDGCWGAHRDLVWSNGGEFFDDPTHHAPTKTMTTEPEFIEAYQFMADCYLEHQVTLTPADSELLSEGAYLSGKVGITWNWNTYGDMKKANFEWTIIPTPWQVRRPNKYGGNSWLINSGTEAADAAWEFVKFVSMDIEGRTLMAEKGTVSCYDPISLLPTAESDQQRMLWSVIIERAKDAAEDDAARPYGLGTHGPELESALGDAMDEIILGGASVAEQMQTVADRIDPLLVG